MKAVFISLELCVGCKQCEIACAVAHSQTQNLFSAVFETPKPQPRIHVETGLASHTSFPNKCRHCNPAPCQMVCPGAAIIRPEDFPDTIQVNPHKCIACGMCSLACPFSAVTYHISANALGRAAVATKCDHCIERLRIGELPACVEACKTNALQFGDVNGFISAERTKYAQAVSIAINQPDVEITTLPANIVAWRNWGAAIYYLNTDVEKGISS